jgi:hypothetical protein
LLPRIASRAIANTEYFRIFYGPANAATDRLSFRKRGIPLAKSRCHLCAVCDGDCRFAPDEVAFQIGLGTPEAEFFINGLAQDAT